MARGQELKNILDIIGEKKIRQTYQLETENRRLIQTYLKERRKEEKEVKKVAKKEQQDKKDLAKYGIKKESLTWEDIAKGTRENYEPKKRNQTSKK
ncbi:22568_t:CDS:2 [Racocetra persica]|uniref:22568_t:CDS:1 n=1 Tax=Racocetra persica TaxID=160502 RepID=A0ACA9PRU9_9GLOM|nr:22568_t:CDS:2 [Racocetra persica]